MCDCRCASVDSEAAADARADAEGGSTTSRISSALAGAHTDGKRGPVVRDEGELRRLFGHPVREARLDLRKILSSHEVVFTRLEEAGMGSGSVSDAWSVEHPDVHLRERNWMIFRSIAGILQRHQTVRLQASLTESLKCIVRPRARSRRYLPLCVRTLTCCVRVWLALDPCGVRFNSDGGEQGGGILGPRRVLGHRSRFAASGGGACNSLHARSGCVRCGCTQATRDAPRTRQRICAEIHTSPKARGAGCFTV